MTIVNSMASAWSSGKSFLGLFLGTFTDALTVLRTVRTPADGQALFVPQIAVTMAFLLAVVSVFALVLFLAHLAKEIRVEAMLDAVHRDAADTLDRLNVRSSRGENWLLASCNVTTVRENVSDVTVIRNPATASRTARAASAPPPNK